MLKNLSLPANITYSFCCGHM